MVNFIKFVKVLSSVAEAAGDIFQKVSCEFFGKTQDAKVLNIYGISFGPPDDSFGVGLQVNGYGNELMVIVDSPGKRFTGLEPGELKIGNYATGAYAYFKADGSVEVSAPDVKIIATTKVEITSPLVEVSGTVEAADFISPSVVSYEAHIHGGVETGGGSTGGPS